MRKDLFGIIYAGEESIYLRELTSKRSVGSIPIGGRYRLIDFLLSNMVNSGIRNIAVVPRKNYHSMMDHLGSGKDWDLNRKNDGLHIIPPYENEDTLGHFSGMFDTLQSAGSFIRSSQQEYCLLTNSHCLYNMNYSEMFDFHIASGADITFLYHDGESPKIPCGGSDEVSFSLDEKGRITEAKNSGAAGDNLSMNICIMKKALLQYLITDNISKSNLEINSRFFTDNLSRLKLYGYPYSGFVGYTTSVASYFKLNMAFLKPEVQEDLFNNEHMILTKIKDSAPTKYGVDAVVKNSLIGSGCQIDGRVENCVLFRNVKVAKGAVLKNSIVMQDGEIYQNSNLSNVILDKRVSVRPNSTLIGSEDYPVVIPKGANV